MATMNGRWDGRLVDAAGFEGEVTFELRAGRGKVTGNYRVALLTQHGGPARRGGLRGVVSEDRITLELIPDSKTDPRVQFKGDVFTQGRGLGMKGVYTVGARVFSPLVGGILCVSTESARGDEEEVRNPDAAPRTRTKRRTQTKRRKKVTR